jgi:hypothetical protein
VKARKAFSIMLAAAAALTPAKAAAWGYEGHAIIADIAAAHLMPVAAKRVSEILKGAPMRDVAYFADLYRLDHRETSRWHFVNIAVGAVDYQPERDCQQIEGQGDCLIAAIARAIDDLKSDGERQSLGLKFLIHLIGDIHQPFHAVTEARGGNEIQVTFFGVPSNLHRVWDTDLIRHSGRTPAAYAAVLNAGYIVGRDLGTLAEGTTIDWAMESRAIGLKAMVPSNTTLGDAYVQAFTPVMDQCLATAGARLAAVLNDALK